MGVREGRTTSFEIFTRGLAASRSRDRTSRGHRWGKSSGRLSRGLVPIARVNVGAVSWHGHFDSLLWHRVGWRHDFEVAGPHCAGKTDYRDATNSSDSQFVA